jgi:hypothetical protein
MAGEATVRSRILAAVLPGDSHARVLARSGEGNLCGCCDRPVERTDVQFDVEVTLDGATRLVPMHRNCFYLWRAAIDNIERDGSAKTSDDG